MLSHDVSSWFRTREGRTKPGLSSKGHSYRISNPKFKSEFDDFVTTQHCDEWAQCCTVGRERSSMIYMTKDMEKRLRVYSLILLGCAFLIIVPVAVATSSAHSAAPVTTRQAQTEERPNPVRRFFTWVMETVVVHLESEVRWVSHHSSSSLRRAHCLMSALPGRGLQVTARPVVKSSFLHLPVVQRMPN